MDLEPNSSSTQVLPGLVPHANMSYYGVPVYIPPTYLDKIFSVCYRMATS